MAVIKTTALVSDIRNKLAGTVFSKNRAGQYMRTKVTPSNPRSFAQQGVRASLSFAAAAWRSLTEAQRQGWNALAQTISVRNIFGDGITLTGEQLFVKANAALLNVGAPTLTGAPALEPATSLTSISVTATSSPQALSVTFAPAPVPANHKLSIFVTPNIPASRGFFRNKFRRLKIVAAAGTSPVNVLSEFQAAYGNVEAGARIGVQAYYTNLNSGLTGIPLSTFVIAS
jgi:hypothetical protein